MEAITGHYSTKSLHVGGRGTSLRVGLRHTPNPASRETLPKAGPGASEVASWIVKRGRTLSPPQRVNLACIGHVNVPFSAVPY